MGIYSRDYIRDPGEYRPARLTNATKTLIIVTAVVFVLQVFTRTRDGGSLIQSWFALRPSDAVHGQIWRLVTYAFCHDTTNIWHIVFNMYFLWWAGKAVESIYGPREFLIFYLLAAAAAGVTYIVLQLAMNSGGVLVGASGAVMAVLMVFAMHFPRERIYFFGVLPLEVRWLVAIYLVIDLLPVLSALGGQAPRDQIAHSAHLGGLAFGFLYKKLNWHFDRGWKGIKLSRVRKSFGGGPSLKIHQPSAELPNLDAAVDAILAKIHDQGEASLTPQERETLKAAANRYKNR